MNFALDTIILLSILLIFTKAGTLILRPHQRKAFDDFFETLTLKIDDINLFQWFLKLEHSSYWYLYALLGLIFPFLLSLYLPFSITEYATSNNELQEQDKVFLALSAWLLSGTILNLILIITAFLRSNTLYLILFFVTLIYHGFLNGLMSSYSISLASCINYMINNTVYAYPNIFSENQANL